MTFTNCKNEIGLKCNYHNRKTQIYGKKVFEIWWVLPKIVLMFFVELLNWLRVTLLPKLTHNHNLGQLQAMVMPFVAGSLMDVIR